VIFPGLEITGKVAGVTVMVLDTGASCLPQASVAVQVSVTVPPQAPGVAVNAEKLEFPEIRQPPVNPLLKLIVLGGGTAPHATVMAAGGVMVGRVAGFTVIMRETEAIVLPQVSVAVHVSVTVPPQISGVGVKVEGVDVPDILQIPVSPLLKLMVLVTGIAPQLTVNGAGAVMTGSAAGLTVIIRDTGVSGLPQASVAVHVSVTVPPQGPGLAVNVDGLEVPVIRHPPVNPLLKLMVLVAGKAPQSTVIAAGAVIVGSAAGETVMVLDTGASALPQASAAVQVSVTVPPQALGVGEKVDGLDVPDIRHPPLNPLVYGRVPGEGMAPQATVIFPGFDMVGSVAGEPVINWVHTLVLPLVSVAVQVRVIVPPQEFRLPASA